MSAASYREAFTRACVAGKDKLSVADVAAFTGLTSSEAAQLVTFFDVDRDGELSFVEYVALRKVFLEAPTGDVGSVAAAFRAWDSDASGVIDAAELAKLRESLGVDAGTWDVIVKRCDVNGDGVVDALDLAAVLNAWG